MLLPASRVRLPVDAADDALQTQHRQLLQHRRRVQAAQRADAVDAGGVGRQVRENPALPVGEHYRVRHGFGVADNRISTISYGKERPAVEGSTESAYERNRRAEFAIVAGEVSAVPPEVR